MISLKMLLCHSKTSGLIFGCVLTFLFILLQGNYHCGACENVYMSQNGVSTLINLIGYMNLPRIKINGLVIIHNLLTYLRDDKNDRNSPLNGFKRQLKEVQGVETLTIKLEETNPKIRRILCDSLRILMLKDPKAKRTFLQHNGTARIIEFLKKADTPKLFDVSLRVTRGVYVLKSRSTEKLEIIGLKAICICSV